MRVAIERPPAVTGAAEDRVVRTFARFLSGATLVFAVLLAPNAVRLSELVPPWWTPIAATVVVLPMLALWPASRAADPRWIHRCGTAAALGYLASLLSWVVVVEDTVPPSADIWVATFPGLITMAAALGWRPVVSLLYLCLSAGAAELVRFVTREGQDEIVLPVEMLALIVFCSLFVVATIAAVQTGRTLDRAVAHSVRVSTEGAADAARDVERRRFHALIHDRVTSTLLGLSRRGATPGLRDQATTALAELDGLRVGAVAAEGFDLDTAIGLIRAALVRVDGDIPVEVDARTSTLLVPRPAARAIAAAAEEALRGSLRHADPADRRADRIVAIDADHDGLRVIVADNGCGYDPDRVPGFDLGVPTGIRERMAIADGCQVVIRSAVDRGTQVTLLWSVPT